MSHDVFQRLGRLRKDAKLLSDKGSWVMEVPKGSSRERAGQCTWEHRCEHPKSHMDPKPLQHMKR